MYNWWDVFIIVYWHTLNYEYIDKVKTTHTKPVISYLIQNGHNCYKTDA
jgi:hypothetical protein